MRSTAALVPVALLCCAAPVLAQVLRPGTELPGQERPKLPDFEQPEEQRPILPPLPELAPQAPLRPDAGLVIPVREIAVAGNTLLPEEAIAEVAGRYAGRSLTTEDLRDLQREITLLYVRAGFATSGARIPDQDVVDGLLVVQIVEGRLVEVTFRGNARFRAGYLAPRVAPHPDAPLNVVALERRLQILQSDPRIRAVRASLQPGLRLGESTLEVQLVEAPAVDLWASVANDRPPALGAVNGTLGVEANSPSGWGDDLTIDTTFSAGISELRARYELPLTRWDTRLGLRIRASGNEIVEEPFEETDLAATFVSVGLLLAQPVYRSPNLGIEAGVLAEWRQTKNFLDGEPFDPTEVTRDGTLRVSVLRIYTEATWRDRVQVLAVRSTFNVGASVLGATRNPEPIEDSDFFSWLGQLQWIRRFDTLGLELATRGDLQLSADRLPSIERFAVGGLNSVRGYRENTFVRDNGLTASIELRVPLWRRADGQPVVQIAPFVDAGRGWLQDRGVQPEQTWLASIGLGLRSRPWRWLRGELYWGYRLIDVPNPDRNLQDHGISFRIVAEAF